MFDKKELDPQNKKNMYTRKFFVSIKNIFINKKIKIN